MDGLVAEQGRKEEKEERGGLEKERERDRDGQTRRLVAGCWVPTYLLSAWKTIVSDRLQLPIVVGPDYHPETGKK